MTLGSAWRGVQLGQRAALYCRVSTNDQSCTRQERDLTAFAEHAGYEVVGVFKETGSGVRLDRAERRKVMALAQARRIDAVLVTELSRWGRSTTDLLATLKELEARRVSVVALSGMTFDLAPQGISHQGPGPCRRVRLHRVLLQSPAAPLDHRISQPYGVRADRRCERNYQSIKPAAGQRDRNRPRPDVATGKSGWRALLVFPHEVICVLQLGSPVGAKHGRCLLSPLCSTGYIAAWRPPARSKTSTRPPSTILPNGLREQSSWPHERSQQCNTPNWAAPGSMSPGSALVA